MHGLLEPSQPPRINLDQWAKIREYIFWLSIGIAFWAAAQTMALTTVLLITHIVALLLGGWVGWVSHEHKVWEVRR